MCTLVEKKHKNWGEPLICALHHDTFQVGKVCSSGYYRNAKPATNIELKPL